MTPPTAPPRCPPKPPAQALGRPWEAIDSTSATATGTAALKKRTKRCEPNSIEWISEACRRNRLADSGNVLMMGRCDLRTESADRPDESRPDARIVGLKTAYNRTFGVSRPL